jgi:hypothetical protein
MELGLIALKWGGAGVSLYGIKKAVEYFVPRN